MGAEWEYGMGAEWEYRMGEEWEYGMGADPLPYKIHTYVLMILKCTCNCRAGQVV